MADVLDTLKSILDSNWTPASTDNLTPTVGKIAETREFNFGNGDLITLYEVDEQLPPAGIGGHEWFEIPTVSIDIRTTYQRAKLSDVRAHLQKMKEEVLRIIRIKVNGPDSNYFLLKPIRKRDLSDKTTGFGRMVVDVELQRIVTT